VVVYQEAGLGLVAATLLFDGGTPIAELHAVCPHPPLYCRTYHPSNPTGSWSLILSHPVHAAIARRLLVGYIQQYDEGLCVWPYHVCFSMVGGWVWYDNNPAFTHAWGMEARSSMDSTQQHPV
jgi:hypothetical protein